MAVSKPNISLLYDNYTYKPIEESDEEFPLGANTTVACSSCASAQTETIEFPKWMIDSLDRRAKRLGGPQHALIKVWLANTQKANSTYLTDAEHPESELITTPKR